MLMAGLHKTVPYEVLLPHRFSVPVKSVDDPMQLRQGSAISSWFVHELFCAKNGPKPLSYLGLFGWFFFPIMLFSQFQEALCMCGGWGITSGMVPKVLSTLFLRDGISLT